MAKLLNFQTKSRSIFNPEEVGIAELGFGTSSTSAATLATADYQLFFSEPK